MAIGFFKGGRDEDALLADINTTPLVDVMLVLLIIFLITIPAVHTSVAVSLPRRACPAGAAPGRGAPAAATRGAYPWRRPGRF